jgi:hypothetical protein
MKNLDWGTSSFFAQIQTELSISIFITADSEEYFEEKLALLSVAISLSNYFFSTLRLRDIHI